MIIFVKLNLCQNKYQKIIFGWTSPLIILDKGSEMECFINDSILDGILKGPEDLLRSSEDMQLRTSFSISQRHKYRIWQRIL